MSTALHIEINHTTLSFKLKCLMELIEAINNNNLSQINSLAINC